jgi:hypothetical protein
VGASSLQRQLRCNRFRNLPEREFAARRGGQRMRSLDPSRAAAPFAKAADASCVDDLGAEMLRAAGNLKPDDHHGGSGERESLRAGDAADPGNANVPADRARYARPLGPRRPKYVVDHVASEPGCSKQSLINTGGAGHLYCFATN